MWGWTTYLAALNFLFTISKNICKPFWALQAESTAWTEIYDPSCFYPQDLLGSVSRSTQDNVLPPSPGFHVGCWSASRRFFFQLCKLFQPVAECCQPAASHPGPSTHPNPESQFVSHQTLTSKLLHRLLWHFSSHESRSQFPSTLGEFVRWSRFHKCWAKHSFLFNFNLLEWLYNL